ncbi:MAG: hypothetical protein E6I67_01755 [Chloroflexi bacterium]|nr:MAG: hypothetical protein E6I67_01755 [Chloroflexota bacterium]
MGRRFSSRLCGSFSTNQPPRLNSLWRPDALDHPDVKLLTCTRVVQPLSGAVAGPVARLRIRTKSVATSLPGSAILATLPVIALHSLRHAHATLLFETGVNVKTVSESLGHDSVQTTLELYGHVTPRMRSNAAERFGLLLMTARTAPTSALTAEN